MITLRTSITGAVLALGLASAGCVSVLPEQPKPEAVYRLPDPQTRVELETPKAPRLIKSKLQHISVRFSHTVFTSFRYLI